MQEDDSNLSQNSQELQASLTLLLDDIQNPNDVHYFKQEEARQKRSDARKLVESAFSGFKNFENKHRTKIICLAIALGDSTLDLFLKCLGDKEDIHVTRVMSGLVLLLKLYFCFDDAYAQWLSRNLEHLNRGSLDILKDLKTSDFEHVRYSTVVSINN